MQKFIQWQKVKGTEMAEEPNDTEQCSFQSANQSIIHATEMNWWPNESKIITRVHKEFQ